MSQVEQSKILKETIEEKQAKAEKQRDMHIKNIQEKAKEEGLKSGEIALLTAMNLKTKKIEAAHRHQILEARRQEIEEERLRKLADVAAHQEAANERRRIFQEERQAKLKRDEEKKKERETMRERERRESIAHKEAAWIAKRNRVNELEAKLIDKHKELKKKFQTKLEKWSIRYNETMTKKKERAALANLNARIIAENAKKTQESQPATSVNSLIPALIFEDGELLFSPMIIKVTVESNLNVDQVVQRLHDACSDYEFIPSSLKLPACSQSMKIALEALTDVLHSGVLPTDISGLSDILRILEDDLTCQDALGKESFCDCGGLAVLFNSLMLLDDDGNLVLPISLLDLIVKTVLLTCSSNVNKEYLLLSMDICIEELAELFIRVMSLQDNVNTQWLNLSCNLITLLEMLFVYLPDDSITLRKSKADFLCYITSVETIDIVFNIFSVVKGPLEEAPDPVARFLTKFKGFLVCRKMDGKLLSMSIEAFENSDFDTLITMLVSLVLHNGLTSRIAAQERVSSQTVVVTCAGLNLLNNLCSLDVRTVQNIVASEGVQPQVLHLIVFWMSYFFHWDNVRSGNHDELERTAHLGKLIASLLTFIANICFDCPANQALMRFGPGFIVLKMLAALPFRFFVDPASRNVLFPTLLACCCGDAANTLVLKEDMDIRVLVDWAKDGSSRPDERFAAGTDFWKRVETLI
ncbi:Sentrin-specific protease 3 [Entophlyctis luteolus]|nr:Sentrin-specific protease 3 [Entophlyctis luteolus]